MSKDGRKKYIRFQYTEEGLQEALQKINERTLSISGASRSYGIPKSTLFNKLKGKVPLVRKMGPTPILTTDEENLLENWILSKAILGFPMHADEVKDSVQRVLKTVQRENPFVENRPGRKWLKLFLQRHPKISIRNTEIISKSRASVTEAAIRGWFQELHNYLQTENCTAILNDPTRIFNADETGLQTCPKSGKVLGPKNYRNFYEIASGPEKECITVLCTFSASGTCIPPMIIYPYKRIPRDIAQTIPEDWGIGRSDSGWMTSATFYEFIANIFSPWLDEHKVKRPVLFLLDGHKSHINMKLYNFCVQNQIILYCLLPNATHILQPCDVSVFKSLKARWKIVVRNHKQETTKSITKNTFAQIFHRAYEEAIKPEINMNGFRKCGLYPFSAEAVNYSQCISTRRHELADHQPLLELGVPTASDYQAALKVLESHVSSNLLTEFKNTGGQEKTVDNSLYDLWKICTERSGSGAETVHNNVVEVSENNYETIETGNLFANSDIDNDIYTPEDFMKFSMEIDGVLFEIDKLENNETSYIDNNDFESMMSSERNVYITEDSQTCIDLEKSSPNISIDIVKPILNIIIEAVFESVHDQTKDQTCNSNARASEHQKIIVHSNIKIEGSIWSQHLHWPKVERTGKKKTPTAPMPFAITSKKWKEYEQNKESEKKEKEDAILKRKVIRENKKKERCEKNTSKTQFAKKRKTTKTEQSEENGKTSPIPKKKKTNSSENTLLEQTNMVQSVTGRRKTVSHEIGSKPASGKVNKLGATITSDESTLPAKENGQINIGSYVIVKYQKKYFPGIVVDIEENEYEVKTMTPLIGSNLFKWPNPKDQIWNKKNQIMKEIAAPILKKLGSFECQEIDKYYH